MYASSSGYQHPGFQQTAPAGIQQEFLQLKADNREQIDKVKAKARREKESRTALKREVRETRQQLQQLIRETKAKEAADVAAAGAAAAAAAAAAGASAAVVAAAAAAAEDEADDAVLTERGPPPAEFLELQQKLVQLERRLEENESHRAADVAQVYAAASTQFSATMQEQGRMNLEISRELVAQGDRGSERASIQTTAAVGNMSRDFTEHLAQQAERARQHQKEIMEIHLQIARENRAAAELQSNTTTSALTGWNRGLDSFQKHQSMVIIS